MAELEVCSITKEYCTSRTNEIVLALNGVCLEVERGQFAALVGPSGCGKSTLLKIIAGLEVKGEGSVLLDGQEITGPSWTRGMVFQDFALPPWKTVKQNIELGPRFRGVAKKEREDLSSHLIKLVGLKGFENKFPHELSGGMRQRCALARTLANDPEMLLLDEPFASVDAQTRELLQEELLKIWGEELPQSKRKLVILVTHSIDEAVFLSDVVFVMTARPGCVKEVFLNPLGRPRDMGVKSSRPFLEARNYLWDRLKDEVLTAIQQGYQ
ncbi:MAG: ABC transporter ATP-binding protein [Thermodesulfobacteriota bacterium]